MKDVITGSTVKPERACVALPYLSSAEPFAVRGILLALLGGGPAVPAYLALFTPVNPPAEALDLQQLLT